MPQHFTEEVHSIAADWNKRRKELKENEERLAREFDDFAQIILKRIQNSQDEASEALDEIFSKAKGPSEENIAKHVHAKSLAIHQEKRTIHSAIRFLGSNY
jgi:hypothetical protein